MAVTITYNSDIVALYQTFYTKKQVDLIESLAWLVANEKSYGVSMEQLTLIKMLANFYFEILSTLHKDSSWTYLDWLTQAEYDDIMYNRELMKY